MAAEHRDINYDSLSLPDICLVHRYRYYVLNKPAISDKMYDMFEIKAKQHPEYHKINMPGSSIESDYSEDIVRIANNLDTWYDTWYDKDKRK